MAADDSDMRTSRRPPRQEKAVRQWHLLPPLTHGGEPLEGAATLDEVPGPAGVLLWQALRDVLLWAETPQAERGGLFAPGSGRRRAESIAGTQLHETLVAPLLTLTTIVEDPCGANPEAVADACAAIASWARGVDAPATALAFAQDAALAAPDDAATAIAVAHHAHRAGDHARAELWYRRGTGLARRSRDWRLYTEAFSGLGALYRHRGNLPAAHRFHLRALRGARRGGLRKAGAVALHDLFAVAVDAGRARDAERFAREAAAAYPAGSERLVTLAHDIAYHWMEAGHFERALAVFDCIIPRLRTDAERLWAEANRMRAAAGAGRVEVAEAAAERVAARIADPAVAPAAASAQLEIARGELQLGRLDRALRAAEAAVRLGRERREGRTVMSAEAVLEAVDAAHTSRGRRARPPVASRPLGRGGEALARRLIEALGAPESHVEDSQREEITMQVPRQPGYGPR